MIFSDWDVPFVGQYMEIRNNAWCANNPINSTSSFIRCAGTRSLRRLRGLTDARLAKSGYIGRTKPLEGARIRVLEVASLRGARANPNHVVHHR